MKETLRCFLASDSLCGFLIHRSHRDISRNLVLYQQDLRGFPLTHDDWHGGSHPRVSSFSDGASHRLCVEHSYICSVCSCEHHTIIIFDGGAHPSFFVEVMRYFLFCKEVPVIIIVSFALSGSVMNTIPPGCGGLLHTISVDMEFSCLRRGPSDDQRYICTVWSCGTHLSH